MECMALLSSALVVVRPGFLATAALVAVGAAFADTAVRGLRNQAGEDAQFTGSNGVYALVGAALTHAGGTFFGLGTFTRPIALGMVAKGALAMKQELTE